MPWFGFPLPTVWTITPAIAAVSLALYYDDSQLSRFQLPGFLAGAGIFCSALGVFAVSTKEKGEGWNSNLGALMWALEKGMYLAGIVFIGCAYGICSQMFATDLANRIFGCIVVGLITGMAIGKTTEYLTSFDFGPVISIKDRGVTGPATVVIQGIGIGMISCAPTTVLLVALAQDI